MQGGMRWGCQASDRQIGKVTSSTLTSPLKKTTNHLEMKDEHVL